jgi:hypothetical protein
VTERQSLWLEVSLMVAAALVGGTLLGWLLGPWVFR